MFGKQEIAKLRAWLKAETDRADVFYKSLRQKESELSILQEAFRNGVKITDDLKEKIARFEVENETLKYELSEARLLNETIKDEAAESSRMLELYKAVFQQLQIVIKLPARKPKA